MREREKGRVRGREASNEWALRTEVNGRVVKAGYGSRADGQMESVLTLHFIFINLYAELP